MAKSRFQAFLGRRCVASGNVLQKVVNIAKIKVQDDVINPSSDGMTGSIVVWDTDRLLVVVLVVDDGNGVHTHDIAEEAVTGHHD